MRGLSLVKKHEWAPKRRDTQGSRVRTGVLVRELVLAVDVIVRRCVTLAAVSPAPACASGVSSSALRTLTPHL